ncbi:hypothetical protein P7H21_25140 [Paenibacillus larvae]|nr:hypothetical protein [Paenibacillus larvae]MDT2306577.1 hypothetical protein [Paenibacillus larvae]
MLTDRGREKLAEVKRVESLEAKILTQSNLTYRKDYDLGDVVTVLGTVSGVDDEHKNYRSSGSI